MMERLSKFWFSLRFFFRTGGCTEAWLRKLWVQLIEHDIHPDEDLELHTPKGQRFHVSAFGSQLWVRWANFEFTINFSQASGLYIHERQMRAPFSDPMEWILTYRERPHFIFGSWLSDGQLNWAYSMKLLAANLTGLEDRSEQNTVDYR